MSADYDIFISYHGDSHGRNSSYPVADKLKEFFEGHEGKKFKCFLCRRERPDDFYDAINQALLSAKHFILVACDKDGLSDWVADEIKQFDGLRKIGKKPNSIINAYIYGDIQIDDLLDFNPLFSTKDIAYGEDGFAKLYAMVLEKSLQTDRKLSFNFRKDVIEGLVFLCPLTQRFQNKIKGYLAKDSDPAAKERVERAAVERLAGCLPEGAGRELRGVWEEYEACRTPEAKLVKALDKAETILQHNQGQNPSGFDYGFNLGYGAEWFRADEMLQRLRGLLDADTLRHLEK